MSDLILMGTKNNSKAETIKDALKDEESFYKVIKPVLELMNFKDVQETRKNRKTSDYGVDYTATTGDEKWAIQAKFRSKSACGNDAVNEVVGGKNHYHATRTLVITNGRFTDTAKKTALVNSTRLIDRESIIEAIDGKSLDAVLLPYPYAPDYEQLREEYHRVKKDYCNGRPPTERNIKEHSKYRVSKFKKAVLPNTWNTFIKQMGDVPVRNTKIKNDELVKNYNHVKQKVGRVPTLKDLSAHGDIDAGHYTKYKSKEFQKRHGYRIFLLSQKDRPNRNEGLSKKELEEHQKKYVGELRSLKEILGRTPTLIEFLVAINKTNIRPLFKTYAELQSKAGIAPRIRKASKKLLVENYNSVKKELKVPDSKALRQKDIDSCGSFKSDSYRRYWGSWNNFLRKYKQPLNLNNMPSEERLEQAIESYLQVCELLDKESLSFSEYKLAKGEHPAWIIGTTKWNTFKELALKKAASQKSVKAASQEMV